MASGTNKAHVAAVPQADASLIRRAAGAAGAGTIVEYFDYALYGYLATTIATVFFPPGNDTAALLGTFAVFGVKWATFEDIAEDFVRREPREKVAV